MRQAAERRVLPGRSDFHRSVRFPTLIMAARNLAHRALGLAIRAQRATLAGPRIAQTARASSEVHTPAPHSEAAGLPRRPLSRAADDVLVPDFAGVADPAFSPDEKPDIKRARLMYMARKRGILESDLLMGTFASKYLKEMSAEELDEFDSLLRENDWDLYYVGRTSDWTLS